MIPCSLPPEPQDFDSCARRPGLRWLSEHQTGRPKNLWSPFLSYLADGFRNLCAYSAMYEPVGEVDHYLSMDHPLRPENRKLAYEWSNYRFASRLMNNKKRNEDDQVLDPLVVQEGWFAVSLPGLQLCVTECCPAEFRKRALFTIKRLGLEQDERVLRQRRHWLAEYEETNDLSILEHNAPLLAAAVRKKDAQGDSATARSPNSRNEPC